MILGFVGFIGSGKNTVGDFLYAQGFVRESFAGPVKDIVSIVFGWNRAMLEGNNKIDRKWREEPDEFWSDKFGREFSPRDALQLMGTEAGREVFHQDLWIYALEKRISAKLKNYPDTNFVITDVRFQNEIRKIVNMGGFVYRIKKDQEPFYYNDALWYNTTVGSELPNSLYDTHQSEWDWIGCPLIKGTIENNGSLEELYLKITKLVDSEFFK